MPVILTHEEHKFKQKTDLMKKDKSRESIDYYKSPFMKNIEIEEGGSLFSGIGSIVKTGVDFIGKNKDIIGNVATGVGSVGSAAANIAKAVESNKKLEQLKKIEEIRNKTEEKKKKTLSEKTKKELAEKFGDGFTKVT